MTVTLSAAQVRADLEALGIDIPPQIAYKAAAPVAPVKPKVEVVGDEGRVRAIVSVTGVEDEVADIILPGAYRETLTKRKPKVCWHHEWAAPIGRTESIEEWAPGDRRLPTHTKDGKPWPKDAGALVATMVFNLKSERGREAFEAVKFYTESNECEWSIGYQVPPGQSIKDRQGRRLIKGLELYELSFVLFGAAPLSMTLDLKSAVEAWQTKSAMVPDGQEPTTDLREIVVDVKALHEAAEPGIDWDLVRVAAAIGTSHVVDVKAITAQPSHRFEVGRKVSPEAMLAAAKSGAALGDGSYPIESEHDLRAALDHVEAKGITDPVIRDHVAGRAIALGRTDLLPSASGPEAKAGGADRNRGNAEDLRRWYVHGEGAAKIRWGEPGDFMRCVRIAGKHMTPENAKGYCNLRHQEATGAAPGHAASEQRGKKAAPAPQPRTPVESKGAEKMIGNGVMVALSLPEGLPERLAVKDGSPPEALHVTMAFLGDAEDLDGEAADTLVAAVKALAAYVPPMSGTIGGLGQFPDHGDGVPVWVPVDVPMLAPVRERLITILGESGIKATLNHGYTPHITLGYDVKGASPVPATDVVFSEIAVHIGDRVERIPLGAAVTGYDPALDKPVEGKAMEMKVDARLAGTMEEQIDRLQSAARDAFGDSSVTDEVAPTSRYVHVSATWPDRILVTVHEHGDCEHFEVPYTIRDGAVSLGEPEKVTVTATLAPEPGHDHDADDALGRYAEALMDEVSTTFALHAKPVEGKAGRVLSGANTTRLQAAVQNLLTVLEAAGVVIIKPAPGDVEAEQEQLEARSGSFAPTPDTTSVAASRAVGVKSLTIGEATPDGKVRIGRDEHLAMLARLEALGG